jgi:hypothetical protein
MHVPVTLDPGLQVTRATSKASMCRSAPPIGIGGRAGTGHASETGAAHPAKGLTRLPEIVESPFIPEDPPPRTLRCLPDGHRPRMRSTPRRAPSVSVLFSEVTALPSPPSAAAEVAPGAGTDRGPGRLSGGGCADPIQLLKSWSRPLYRWLAFTARRTRRAEPGCGVEDAAACSRTWVVRWSSGGVGSEANFVRLWTLRRAGLAR